MHDYHIWLLFNDNARSYYTVKSLKVSFDFIFVDFTQDEAFFAISVECNPASFNLLSCPFVFFRLTFALVFAHATDSTLGHYAGAH